MLFKINLLTSIINKNFMELDLLFIVELLLIFLAI